MNSTAIVRANNNSPSGYAYGNHYEVSLDDPDVINLVAVKTLSIVHVLDSADDDLDSKEELSVEDDDASIGEEFTDSESESDDNGTGTSSKR